MGASTLASLVVRLVGDSSGLAQELAEAEKKAQGFGDKMKGVGDKLNSVGAGMTAGLTLPIVAGMNEAANKASDLSETISKTNVVFGENAAQVVAFAEKAGAALGQSKQQALDAASGYGNLFVSMGMTTDKSAEMSMGITALSSDLASFNNLNTVDVLDKMRAGLTGETEPLKALGVNINAAAVQAKAMSMGLSKADVDMVKVNGTTLKLSQAQANLAGVTKQYGADSNQASLARQKVAEAEQAVEKAMAGSKVELDASAKAQATYALIMEQTKTAQGDFARTSDGLANSQRIQAALFENTASSIGEKLLPIKLKLVTVISDLLKAFQSLSPETQTTILIVLGIVAAIGPLLLIAGQLFTAIGTLTPVFATFSITLAGPVIAAIAAAIAIGFVLYKAWTENWGGIREKVGEALFYIKGIVLSVLGGVQSFIQAHSSEINAVLSMAWNLIKTVVTGIIVPLAGGIIARLREVALFITTHGDEIRGIFEGAWNIIYGSIQVTLGLITGIVKLTIAILKGDWSGAWDALEAMTKASLDGLTNIAKGLYQIGANIISGLINGIRSMGTQLAGELANVVNTAVNQVKSWLGIQSPSKVFYGFGMNMMKGLANGIDGYGDLPQVQLDTAITGLTSTGMQAARDVRGAGAGGQRGAATANVTVNVYGAADRAQVSDGVVDGLRRSGFQVVGA